MGPYQGINMNSRNHHMFSSVGHYLVTQIAGLTLDQDEAQVTAVVGQLQNSSSKLRTRRGDVSFSWAWLGESMEVKMEIPVGMHANIHFPAQITSIYLDGKAVDGNSLGVHAQLPTVRVTVGSGSYRFNGLEIATFV